MSRIFVIGPMAVLLAIPAGCIPTATSLYNERAAGYNEEMARARKACEAQLTSSAYLKPTNAEHARYCFRLFEAAETRYGFPADTFLQARRAYMVAVYERLDRGELTLAQADFLIAEFNRRLEMERSALMAAQLQAGAAAMATFGQQVERDPWANFWRGWSQFQERQYRLRLNCWTNRIGTSVYTTCD